MFEYNSTGDVEATIMATVVDIEQYVADRPDRVRHCDGTVSYSYDDVGVA